MRIQHECDGEESVPWKSPFGITRSSRLRSQWTSNTSIPVLRSTAWLDNPDVWPRPQNKGAFFSYFSCCGYSKEPSQWDGSFEHPKHMFKLMVKEINAILDAQTIPNWTHAAGGVLPWWNCQLVLQCYFGSNIITLAINVIRSVWQAFRRRFKRYEYSSSCHRKQSKVTLDASSYRDS